MRTGAPEVAEAAPRPPLNNVDAAPKTGRVAAAEVDGITVAGAADDVDGTG